MSKFTTYFTEALQELNQVRWPTRQQAVRLSIIVFAFTAAATAAYGALDFVLGQVVKLVLTLV